MILVQSWEILVFILSGCIGTRLRISLTLGHLLAGAWLPTPNTIASWITLLLQKRKWRCLVVAYLNGSQSLVAKWDGPLLAQVWSQDTCPLLLGLQTCTQQRGARLPYWIRSTRSCLTWHHHPMNLWVDGVMGGLHSLPPMYLSPTHPFSGWGEGHPCLVDFWFLSSLHSWIKYVGKNRLELSTCYL